MPGLSEPSRADSSPIARITCLSAVHPSAPKTSKKAALGLKAAAWGAVCLMRFRQKSSADAADDSFKSLVCGSSPMHNSEEQSWARFSRSEKKLSIMVQSNAD